MVLSRVLGSECTSCACKFRPGDLPLYLQALLRLHQDLLQQTICQLVPPMLRGVTQQALARQQVRTMSTKGIINKEMDKALIGLLCMPMPHALL